MKKAIVTIASNNYFAQVKVLMKSMEISNPEWDRYFILVDEKNDDIWNEDNNFYKLHFTEIGIENTQAMAFYYDVLELNTAVKPFAISYLFRKKNYDQVMYLDPDIYVYNKLFELEKEFLKGASIVLTPHLIDELKDDGYLPDEKSVLGTGVFNLGFIAFQNSEESLKAIDWWSEKCKKHCVNEIENGIFVDQKWVDYFPSRYKNLSILKDAGYNVAYWNLPQRKLQELNGKILVNDTQLSFFHFSGLNERNTDRLSKYSNRPLKQNCILKTLIEEYVDNLKKNESEKYKEIVYAYNYFSDGKIIRKIYREFYRKNGIAVAAMIDNPFEQSGFFCRDDSPIRGWTKGYFECYKTKVIDKLKNTNNIVIFGKGDNGRRVYRNLKQIGLEKSVKCYCDNDVAVKEVDGVNVYNPKKTIEKFENAFFLITPEQHQNEIIFQLMKEGVNGDNIMILSVKEIYEIFDD